MLPSRRNGVQIEKIVPVNAARIRSRSGMLCIDVVLRVPLRFIARCQAPGAVVEGHGSALSCSGDVSLLCDDFRKLSRYPEIHPTMLPTPKYHIQWMCVK